jgi:serine/threonine protein kinase
MEPLLASDPEAIGPYRLLGRIGTGGMGVVYLAEDDTGTQVAVKLIRDELAQDPAFRTRFAREVRAGQRVGGMCTARYLSADLDSTHPYLVTEYVAGGNLLEFVRAHGPLEGERLVGLAVGLAEALVAMGAVGVIHRDLKPSNVLMAEHGPKVVDFGISHAADGTSLTQTGVVVGSPSWMAPEQAQGRESGAAVDVFSWGATVAFAATGRAPFGEGRPEAVVYRVVHEEPDLDGIDPRLLPHVRASLVKEPTDRPSADSLLVGVIKTAMAGEPLAIASLDGATEVLDRTWVQPPPADPKPQRGRQIAIALAALTIVAAFAAGVLYVAHRDAKGPKHHAALAGVHNTTKSAVGTTTTAPPTTTTTTAANQNPTETVVASLPVVACPTSYGVEPAPAPKSLPSALNATIPKDLANQLSVYADEAGLMDVLAPKDWDCTASFGADGSSLETVTPTGVVLPDDSNSLPAGSTDEAVVSTQNGGCQGCADYQACPYFSAAAQDLGSPCTTTPPSTESIVPISATVVSFSDPPDTTGGGNPSGGEYPANAVMTYVTDPPGSDGHYVTSWLETCTLPYGQQALCTAVLNDFVARYKNGD